jgi:L-serine dehydratase|tara:strand:- start:2977 stop:4299 length:1323 start_codon:yes stop_codon:yes gene_type:complete
MIAARRFLLGVEEIKLLGRISSVRVDLFGSLAMTGHGHGTDRAILLGLMGETPAEIKVAAIAGSIAAIEREGELRLLGRHTIRFSLGDHIHANKGVVLPSHPNGMTFSAFDGEGRSLAEESYYSIGGGFVLSANEIAEPADSAEDCSEPFPIDSMAELLYLCEKHELSIADLTVANELQFRSREEVFDGLYRIWKVMDRCIEEGCAAEGVLPGGLAVKRRAYDLHRELKARMEDGEIDSLAVMDWISLFALAVNEQNAAGARVVTAPTNGAAGVIPAVLAYYIRFVHTADAGDSRQAVVTFLLTAAAIGILFKKNASISAAEVGCQGEIGVACSMAAAGLTATMGGTVRQIENAAEIGMEHNLGLTCDPVGGLVQIPCIERNTMGAVKAINASRLALRGDGHHHVSLDQVIETMRQTGRDMQAKYKETSEGGLAVNMVDC